MTLPTISAVVCTRGRGTRLVPTIETILQNDHPAFELIVVDQNVDDVSADAIRQFGDDPRLQLIRTSEVGLGRARNTGLNASRAPIVAFTDDDVTVPPNWLWVMEQEIRARPAVAVAFCNVVAAAHDETLGFIPDYVRDDAIEVGMLFGKCRARGIGAGLAVRRDPMLQLGGFDPLLGAGGRFSSCEDGDAAVRALIAGWHVLETPAVAVVHDGFRTWEEGRALTRRDWYGIGAAYSKPIKAGHLRALVIVGYEGIVRAILSPIVVSIRQRRGRGLRQGWYFWRGFIAGLRHPIDRGSLIFREALIPPEPGG